VLNELEKGRGTQFDATFVDILLRLIREGVIDLNKLYNVQPEDAEQEAAKQEKADPGAKAQGGNTEGADGRKSEGT